MEENKEYYVFISYKSEDVEWAIWLQHELEHYHLPASFNGRTDIRQELRPVFRDIDELSAGNLPKQIKQALENSQNLIVVCSPQSAASPWVNQEVETFISLGRTDRIFPFIIEGNSPKEFFPSALLALPKNEERLGGNASKQGRDIAFVKVVAGMLGLSFDSLWNRYEKEKAEQERINREERDNLLKVQSRYLAEKSMVFVEDGDSYMAILLALKALPKELENPNRPYVLEAEKALRIAIQSHTTILKHADAVTGVSFSFDGKYIVSASVDNIVRVWDAKTGALLMLLQGHKDSVNSVAFSPNGKLIASASQDKTIIIWDFERGHIIRTFKGHEKSVNSIAFSPDGNWIVSGSDDYLVQLWNLETNERKVLVFDEFEVSGFWENIAVAYVTKVTFSPDGNFVMSSLAGNEIHIWDWRTRKIVKYIYGTNGVYNNDGTLVAYVREDQTIIIHDIINDEILHELVGHTQMIHSLSFSSDGKFLISASGVLTMNHDNGICVWDISSGQLLKKYNKHYLPVQCVAFSPDCRTFASASWDKTIRIWNISSDVSKSIINTKNEIVNKVAFDSNGNLIAYIIFPTNYIKVLHFEDGMIENITDSPIRRGGISYTKFFDNRFSHDGKYGLRHIYDEIVIYDTCKLKNVYTLKNKYTYHVKQAIFSPDDSFLVVFSRDENNGCFSMWEVLRKKKKLPFGFNKEFVSLNYIKSFSGFGWDIKGIEISPNMKYFAVFIDLTIAIYDIEKGVLHKTIEGHSYDIRSVSFSPDSKKIVSTSLDKTIKVWDIKSGELIQTFVGHSSVVTCAKFSLDGNYIVSASPHEIGIWHFPELQHLIDDMATLFNNRELSKEERKKYCLE